MERRKKSSVCRVCIKWDTEIETNNLNIFDEFNNFIIYEELNNIANIGIKPRDGLPDRICDVCVKELENVIKFKQKCQYSNSILLSTARIYENSDQEIIIGAKAEDISLPCKVSEKSFLIGKIYFNEDSDQEIIETKTKDLDFSCSYSEENVINSNTPSIKSEKDYDNTITNLSNKTNASNVECNDCGELFKSKCKLRVHWKKTHLLSHLTCDLCKRQFKSYKSFHTHKKKKSLNCITASKVRIEGEGRSRIFYCKDCQYSTLRIKDMKCHLIVHTGEKPYGCKLCPKTFTQQSSLQSHLETFHKNYVNEFMCYVCGKCIKGRTKMYRHMLTHKSKELKCDVCHITLKTKTILNNHMKRHSNMKSYFCEKCSARFYTLGELSNHRSRVHKKKRYECNTCGYGSYYNSNLLKHYQKHVTGYVACNVCGKFFENDTQLKLHQKCHFEKNHPCSQCESKFSTKKLLWKHVDRMHKIASTIQKGISIKTDLEHCVVKEEKT